MYLDQLNFYYIRPALSVSLLRGRELDAETKLRLLTGFSRRRREPIIFSRVEATRN